MKDCESIRKSLDAWLDGELGGPEAGGVEGHLQECAACLEQKRRLERIQLMLKDSLEREASRLSFRSFWSGVEQRISARRPGYENLLARLRPLLQPQRLAWAAPLMILFLLAIFYSEPYFVAWRAGQSNLASVESIDTHGFNVAVFKESETKTTVIWLFDNQEDEETSSEEAEPARPSF